MHAFRRTHRQQFALWLAIAAMLLRAVIPDGFMPEHRAGRGLVLAFCTAGPLAGLRVQQLGVLAEKAERFSADSHQGAPGQPAAEGHASCPFAGAAVPSLPTAQAAISGFPHGGIAPPGLIAAAIVHAVAGLRPPPRAPPLYT